MTPSDSEHLARAFIEGADQTHAPEVEAMIDEAVRRVHLDFEQLPVEVRFVDHDPYASFEEMRDQVQSTGVLYIWTGASDVPMWDEKTNWKARAVHDWDHISAQFDFTMAGEYEGFRVASRKVPQLAPLFLSEIAMQAAVANVYGDFAQAQKIVLLPPEEFQSFRGAPDTPGEYVQMVAAMRSMMDDPEVAAALGAAGVEGPLMLIEAARIYDAMVEGQLGTSGLGGGASERYRGIETEACERCDLVYDKFRGTVRDFKEAYHQIAWTQPHTSRTAVLRHWAACKRDEWAHHLDTCGLEPEYDEDEEDIDPTEFLDGVGHG